RWRARLRHHLPRFDLGSIWAWFDVVPVQELRAELVRELGTRAHGDPRRPFTLGAALLGRRADPDRQGPPEHDGGGEAWLRVRRRRFSAGARVSAWGGALQPLVRATGDLQARAHRSLWLYGRAALWRLSDLEGEAIASVAGTFGVRLDLAAVTRLRGEVELAWTENEGTRLRGLASLVLGVLR
ncbi:MAG: hypothetical protein AAGH15_18325, partial [Myxococcota bacterium]